MWRAICFKKAEISVGIASKTSSYLCYKLPLHGRKDIHSLRMIHSSQSLFVFGPERNTVLFPLVPNRETKAPPQKKKEEKTNKTSTRDNLQESFKVAKET